VVGTSSWTACVWRTALSQSGKGLHPSRAAPLAGPEQELHWNTIPLCTAFSPHSSSFVAFHNCACSRFPCSYLVSFSYVC